MPSIAHTKESGIYVTDGDDVLCSRTIRLRKKPTEIGSEWTYADIINNMHGAIMAGLTQENIATIVHDCPDAIRSLLEISEEPDEASTTYTTLPTYDELKESNVPPGGSQAAVFVSNAPGRKIDGQMSEEDRAGNMLRSAVGMDSGGKTSGGAMVTTRIGNRLMFVLPDQPSAKLSSSKLNEINFVSRLYLQKVRNMLAATNQFEKDKFGKGTNVLIEPSVSVRSRAIEDAIGKNPMKCADGTVAKPANIRPKNGLKLTFTSVSGTGVFLAENVVYRNQFHHSATYELVTMRKRVRSDAAAKDSKPLPGTVEDSDRVPIREGLTLSTFYISQDLPFSGVMYNNPPSAASNKSDHDRTLKPNPTEVTKMGLAQRIGESIGGLHPHFTAKAAMGAAHTAMLEMVASKDKTVNRFVSHVTRTFLQRKCQPTVAHRFVDYRAEKFTMFTVNTESKGDLEHYMNTRHQDMSSPLSPEQIMHFLGCIVNIVEHAHAVGYTVNSFDSANMFLFPVTWSEGEVKPYGFRADEATLKGTSAPTEDTMPQFDLRMNDLSCMSNQYLPSFGCVDAVDGRPRDEQANNSQIDECWLVGKFLAYLITNNRTFEPLNLPTSGDGVRLDHSYSSALMALSNVREGSDRSSSLPSAFKTNQYAIFAEILTHTYNTANTVKWTLQDIAKRMSGVYVTPEDVIENTYIVGFRDYVRHRQFFSSPFLQHRRYLTNSKVVVKHKNGSKGTGKHIITNFREAATAMNTFMENWRAAGDEHNELRSKMKTIIKTAKPNAVGLDGKPLVDPSGPASNMAPGDMFSATNDACMAFFNTPSMGNTSVMSPFADDSSSAFGNMTAAQIEGYTNTLENANNTNQRGGLFGGRRGGNAARHLRAGAQEEDHDVDNMFANYVL
jgi:hypothetical protein